MLNECYEMDECEKPAFLFDTEQPSEAKVPFVELCCCYT